MADVTFNESHEVFVPGRLSILGEHSDWASSYRSANPAVSIGRCLVCVTNEGLYARATASTTPGISYTCTDHAGIEQRFKHAFDLDALHRLARSESFFAYVAGTVAAIIEAYDLSQSASICGIHICNFRTTLPMKKGLSSSAAVCVLVVNCFAAVYGWQLDQNEVMALACKGEKKTPSECGMMDFCVAMGANAVGLMTCSHSGFCRLDRVFVKKPLYFVVADLNKSKNTVKILQALHASFPTPRGEKTCQIHEYVRKSQLFCLDAVHAIETGNTDVLAEIMAQAQQCFDSGALLVCPEELTSPSLHAILSNPDLKHISRAAKGVGSQGDGSVQVLCDSHEQQEQVLLLLTKLGCSGFLLTLPASELPQKSNESSDTSALPVLHTQHVRCALVMATSPLNVPENMEALQPQLLQLLACGISKCSVVCPSASIPPSVSHAGADGTSIPRSGLEARVPEKETENQEFSYDQYQKALLEGSVKFYYHAADDVTARQHSTVQALENIDTPEVRDGSGNVLVIKEEALSGAFSALMRNLNTTRTHCASTSSSATGASSPQSFPQSDPDNDDACIMSMAELKTELLEILMQRKVSLRARRFNRTPSSEASVVIT